MKSAVAIAMVAALAQPAMAANPAALPSSSAASVVYEEVETPQGRAMVNHVKRAVERGQIVVQTDLGNLAWSQASAVSLEGVQFVSIPLLNEGGEWSNLSVQVTSNNKIGEYTEAHFEEISQYSGKITLFQNGVLTVERISTVEAPPVDMEAQPAGLRDAISTLNSCLSAAGIPAWVVAGATAACSFAGGWFGILACYTAAGVASGTVGYCAGKAARKL